MFDVNNYFTPLIKMISEAIDKRTNALLKEYGVTSGQVHILVVLSTKEDHECTLKELERIFSFSQSAIAATAARMEAKGLVSAHVAYDDKRIKFVQLTSKGEDIVDIVKEKIQYFNKELLEGFTNEERTELINSLKIIYKKLV